MREQGDRAETIVIPDKRALASADLGPVRRALSVETRTVDTFQNNWSRGVWVPAQGWDDSLRLSRRLNLNHNLPRRHLLAFRDIDVGNRA
jgi:hypothetical protein